MKENVRKNKKKCIENAQKMEREQKIGEKKNGKWKKWKKGKKEVFKKKRKKKKMCVQTFPNTGNVFFSERTYRKKREKLGAESTRQYIRFFQN